MNKQILSVIGAGAFALTSATGAHAAKAKAKPAPKKAPAKAAKKEVKKAEPKALSKVNLGPLSLEGLIDTRLIVTDDAGPAAVPAGSAGITDGKTRYMGTGKDSRVLFRVSQASLGLSLKTAEKWTLKAHLKADLEPNNGINPALLANADTVGVVSAYMEGAGVLGENGNLLIGVIPAPIMNENGGPLRSTDLTITPSTIGSLLNTLTVEGAGAVWSGKGDEVNGTLTLGIFNNLDGVGVPVLPVANGLDVWNFTDTVSDVRGLGDADGDIGFWISGFLSDDENKITGNVAYANNGGDPRAAAGVADTDFWTIGLEAHPGEGWTLKAQYLDADVELNTVAPAAAAKVNVDAKAWYLLGSYKWDNSTRLSVRYDDFESDLAGNVGEEEEGNAWTVALKHDIEGNQQIGLEYLWVDNDPRFGATAATVGRYTDAEDNLLQLSYKWFF